MVTVSQAGEVRESRRPRGWIFGSFAGRARLVWGLLAACLVVAGVAGSLLGALAVADGHAAQSRRSLSSDAVQVASGLGLAIQRESDLTMSENALAARDPGDAQAGFVQWLASERAHQRYPELASVQLVALVPRAQLTAYENEAAAAIRPAGPDAGTMVPAGNRPFYCLAKDAVAWGALNFRPTTWIDLCALPGSSAMLAERDTGGSSYFAVQYAGLNLLGVQTPVYRGGVVPASVVGRRRAFVGWIGVTIVPGVILASALRGHPGLALTITYRANGYHAAFSHGRAPAHAGHLTLGLAGGWTARVSGPLATASIVKNASALGLLVGGIVLSVVLGALMYVLASGRARARRLVSEKTGELEHLAMHDALTGLPNRVLALDRAEQLLARARRTQLPIAALYIDIDGFKHVNDTFGHATGDQFLKLVAERLASVVRESDTAARLAGDEFLVLLDGSTMDVAPELVAERLLEVLREPYDLRAQIGRQLSVSASIGLALGQRTGAEELLADADVALYSAKTAGKNRYVVFESAMQTAVQDRLAFELDLAEALPGDQLFLVYQPIFDLSTERPTGAEALLRWRHPTRGIISPDVFIPIAEENGLIVAIGRWVLQQACKQAAHWHEQGHPLAISVNVSGRQLDHDELIDDVQHALDSAGLDPSALTIEITETALMKDPQVAAERLSTLKALGVRVAIDDFGTGYSSLAYLRQFPVDAIKIDGSFINTISTSKESTALIHTLVQLGKTLGLQTLGEGIEHPAQLRHLQAAHCDQGQGFLYARPLDPDQIDRFLDLDQESSPVASD
ncbi:MAG: putative bifunctional diguanylate cyclase/phosphodiesterase [Solirubrobacteraceae bacterium]